MEWRIDTSTVGEVKAADLRKTLEASRDHWLKTQAEAAGAAVYAAATGNASKPGHTAPEPLALAEAMKAAAEEHKKKSATLAEQMQAGIDAACALADLHGGLVAATVVGHLDPRHRSGCGKRVTVSVDQTWDE